MCVKVRPGDREFVGDCVVASTRMRLAWVCTSTTMSTRCDCMQAFEQLVKQVYAWYSFVSLLTEASLRDKAMQ